MVSLVCDSIDVVIDLNEELKVKLELGENCSSQGKSSTTFNHLFTGFKLTFQFYICYFINEKTI